MWNSGWDKIFKENEWGKYPDMSIVRFISKKFYNKKKMNEAEALRWLNSLSDERKKYLKSASICNSGIQGLTV